MRNLTNPILLEVKMIHRYVNEKTPSVHKIEVGDLLICWIRIITMF